MNNDHIREAPLTSPHPSTIKLLDNTVGASIEKVPWYRDPVFWFSVPGLGLFADLLFPVQVPEELDRLLNMIILVDALMLGKLCCQASFRKKGTCQSVAFKKSHHTHETPTRHASPTTIRHDKTMKMHRAGRLR